MNNKMIIVNYEINRIEYLHPFGNNIQLAREFIYSIENAKNIFIEECFMSEISDISDFSDAITKNYTIYEYNKSYYRVKTFDNIDFSNKQYFMVKTI